MSLIEVVVTLLLFSISMTVISPQLTSSLAGMNQSANTIAEMYRHGI